jgi:hypothetical protein
MGRKRNGGFWMRNVEKLTLRPAGASAAPEPTAARSWLELMRNNDVPAALQHCTGPATWTDQGRRACDGRWPTRTT